MTGTFDTILGYTVPPLVFIVVLYFLAKPFREPIGRLWRFIKSKTGRGDEQQLPVIPQQMLYYE